MLHGEKWTIPADLTEVGPLVEDAARFLERHGVGESVLYASQLLIEETVSNVCRHAHCLGVQLEVSLNEAEIEFIVEDGGAPFDPLLEAPAPDLVSPLAERRVGGLGVHFVKSIADEVSYERSEGANRLSMRLRGEYARRA